ncbi:hypothetical protein SEMRO_181_G078940.1 [Seminavis robusta]|uniref:Uncharacterized protein n=1 Tax=Seminavis robusta TaxID=568900 RepID=A0A9N8DIT0_9STRA|nr:hypothetical protein SEMRO_181_G078940.1 [Seminavis robusta]|eukprot:Sro181_g078940.1 n/a (147) ;mRNA; r:5152-5592
MLKRITKVALNTITESADRAEDSNSTSIVQLSLTRACALSGLITQGIVNNRNFAINGTSSELKDASALFKYASENDEEAKEFQMYSEVAMEAAADMEAEEEGTSGCTGLERGEAGLWVLIHGLVSPSGLTMNGKFGTICMDGLEEG